MVRFSGSVCTLVYAGVHIPLLLRCCRVRAHAPALSAYLRVAAATSSSRIGRESGTTIHSCELMQSAEEFRALPIFPPSTRKR
jgi:hypothetical protein